MTLELGDLLRKATSEAEARKAATSKREKLKDTRLSTQARAELADEVRRLESAADYRPVALVWRAYRAICTCGETTDTAGQVLVEQRHHRIAGMRRWVEADTPWPDLPRSQLFIEQHVNICAHCAAQKGFTS